MCVFNFTAILRNNTTSNKRMPSIPTLSAAYRPPPAPPRSSTGATTAAASTTGHRSRSRSSTTHNTPSTSTSISSSSSRTSRSPSPSLLLRKKGNHKDKPWHKSNNNNDDENEEAECLYLPTRGIANQTGGSGRYHRPTDQTPRVLSAADHPFQYDTQHQGYSSSLTKDEKKEPEPNTTSTTNSSSSYARYLQSKEEEGGDTTSNKTLQRSSSLGNERPPALPSSNNSEQANSKSYGRSHSSGSITLRQQQHQQHQYKKEQDDEDNEDDEFSTQNNPRHLRAQRLARQKQQQQHNNNNNNNNSSGSSNTTDLRLQTANPAVQAYLARKEQQERDAEEESKRHRQQYLELRNRQQQLQPYEQQPYEQQQQQQATAAAQAQFREKKYHAKDRKSQSNTTNTSTSTSNSTGDSNSTTTYTFQFQPAPKSSSAVPPPPPPPPKPHKQRPPRANSLNNINDDHSVHRARRLLQQGGTNSNSNSNSSSASMSSLPTMTTSTPTSSYPMTSTTQALQKLEYTTSTTTTSSSYNRQQQQPLQQQQQQQQPSQQTLHRPPPVPSPRRSPSPDSSVHRARRLLQEGKQNSHNNGISDSRRRHSTGRASTLASSSSSAASSSAYRAALRSNSSSGHKRNSAPPSSALPMQPFTGGDAHDAHADANDGDDLDKSYGHHKGDATTHTSNNASANTTRNSERDYRNRANGNNNGNNKDQNDEDPNSPPPPNSPEQLLQSIPSNLSMNDQPWSIRVCVVSAVDFPVHVVPNMPLSPVLRLGLVSIPQQSSFGKERLLRDIDRKGLGAIADQMRCTSTKLLSKRDNGAVEFHEEVRWDNVSLSGGGNGSGSGSLTQTQKETLALAIELCARGVLRPANIHESPPPHSSSPQAVGATNSLSPLRLRKATSTDTAATARSGTSSPNSSSMQTDSGEPVGRAGKVMNFLARKANRVRGKPGTEMESANAAAAVAKLLVEGSTSPVPPGGRSIATPPNSMPPPSPLSAAAGDDDDDTESPTKARSTGTMNSAKSPTSSTALQEWDVTLRTSDHEEPRKTNEPTMTDDVRLGSLLIPMTEMEDLHRALQDRSQPARMQKWFEIENTNAAIMNSAPTPPTSERRWLGRTGRFSEDGSRASTSSTSPSSGSIGSGSGRRNPSVLLEVSLYAPEVLDESEDELSDDENDTSRSSNIRLKSFAKRTTQQVRNQLQLYTGESSRNLRGSPSKTPPRAKSVREEQQSAAMKQLQDPVLESGVIDFISIVGARDIGDQRHDDGSKGWVQSTPECCILEQFPPTDDFYLHQGTRSVVLPQKVEWFCFPEGVKLWRGPYPPENSDITTALSQPPIISQSSMKVAETDSLSLALFDAHLNCTTSFNWFVIASNSDKYGSATQKTYGAVIRFYVPAPKGIDPTQDDFAQTLMGGLQPAEEDHDERAIEERKRLWVPIGICITSSIPIVGAMEAILMRTCEMLASRPPIVPSHKNKINNMIQRHLANLTLNFQQPIPGAVNCSVPFLQGAPLQLSLAPSTGLPPLPHGQSIANVCKLLGPEGFNFLLAALLTECKILLHSMNPAHCSMVAEVMTTLIYPFSWSLPYIPVLPMGMLEFIEAPLSYLLGVTTPCLEQIDPGILEDVVVVDLGGGFSASDW